MVFNLLGKLFGSPNERYIKPLYRIVADINALEPALQKLSDEELRARTAWLKDRYQKGEKLDYLLVDAFATVREASRRVLGMRHFDVQMIGGIILHRGMIAEMQTGEGKTLVATLAVYLNALAGEGVHLITVNDYLVTRDAEWMGRIYKFLGLTIGCIVSNIDDETRRAAYAADITYGTNNEFGFDYLRDNMKFRRADMVQRKFSYAIVDEVDSVLIDEARTPLIISGPAEDSSELYRKVNQIIPKLIPGDYEKDEKARSVTLTEDGIEHVENLLREYGILTEGNLYDVNNVALVHHSNQALRAHHLFTRDVDYVVKDNKVIIIDEFTGRMMDGRRYSEGLHQALEAKENVTVQLENQTLAQVTFQNYFRMYKKLAGMTGTAMTEAHEFESIYKLRVISVPTNVPCARKDLDDEIYRNFEDKYAAIVKQIIACHEKKQPVLVGTISIEKSEYLSDLLKKNKIPHHVLNARHHAQEALIISQAGKSGAVTIATNMAGRGTDIQLGGNLDMRLAYELKDLTDPDQIATKKAEIEAEVAADKIKAKEAGGLFVLGTERHESRRIDNQLRGRSGRQGDPGGSRFFLSLQDDLLRIFGTDRVEGVLKRFGMGLSDGEALSDRMLNHMLERAQKRVEARNFEIRKQLLKYDDVMNDQRKVIYEQRLELMEETDISASVRGMQEEVVEDIVARTYPKEGPKEKGMLGALHEEGLRLLALDLPIAEYEENHYPATEVEKRILKAVREKMALKEATYGADVMRMVEKSIVLQFLDQIWKDHLLSLDHLRQGINLRAYAQRDPLNEYKHEAFVLFEELLFKLRNQVVHMLCHVELNPDTEIKEPRQRSTRVTESRGVEESEDEEAGPKTVRHATGPVDPNNPETWGKVQRNDVCPCGSGQKFKNCHGKV